MQQLSFLEPPDRDGSASVWKTLDGDQRARVVLRLAQLIARTITVPGDHNDERAEQDHR